MTESGGGGKGFSTVCLDTVRLDAVIFGGGAAGLWLLDELLSRNCSAVLLEATQLGSGQTIASQGILHGGLKYTLQGLLTRSATSLSDMPIIWSECLAGRRKPDLSKTAVRSECCYLWRTESVSSRLGMIGAKFGLKVTPETIAANDRPVPLTNCPGTVVRLPEQVISPESFIETLAKKHSKRILKIDPENGLEFQYDKPGEVNSLRLTDVAADLTIQLQPTRVIFTAGSGNATLREKVGLNAEEVQRRPLQMVLARGNLPKLNGHCVDGARTRVTVTSDVDPVGRTVWQIGGQVAEDGVAMDERTLIAHAVDELAAAIPGIDLTEVEWATYRVDRAERKTPGGKRPADVQILEEGNVITAWPTKLVLAPKLANEIAGRIQPAHRMDSVNIPGSWPRPNVANPPWEIPRTWYEPGQIPGRHTKAA